MGGRGKKNGGAAGAPLVQEPNGAVTDLNQIVKQMGIPNLEDARKAAEYKRIIDGFLQEAGVSQDIRQQILDGKLTQDQLKQLVQDNPKLADAVITRHVARYLHHGGTLGPIMLRFGLPRNKLLDIVHALKPLRDHGFLSLSMPFTLPGWQDPLAAATAIQNGDVPASEVPTILDWLSQMKVRSYVSDVWLKKVSNVSSNIFKLL